MRILYYNEGEDPNEWLPKLEAAIPEAEIRLWQSGDTAPADYALVWHPPEELLRNRKELKAVFNLAAGVDALLAMANAVPENVPIYRLEDAGMAVQMAEYVTHAVIRYFRRFDEYERQPGSWDTLAPYSRNSFSVGIMGMGIMGQAVANALKPFGLPLRGWARRTKHIPGVDCYAGTDEFARFLSGLKVLVCVLPLTGDTEAILDMDVFRQLQAGAFLINVGRGRQLVENDLLRAMDEGLIRAATLDVTETEPLPKEHPFWTHERITITPHIAALTYCDETVRQVADSIRILEQGGSLTSRVYPERGY